MSYKNIATIAERVFPLPFLFKYGYNLSPMYRRSTARITNVSSDLLHISIRLKVSYKNRNFVGSIFGGSMFSAVDPIPMVQLMYLLGDDYVVWDKSAEIYFKRPAREHLVAHFEYSLDEVAAIKKEVAEKKEITMQKKTALTNTNGTVVFCEVDKTIYVADKQFYKEKQAKKRLKNAS